MIMYAINCTYSLDQEFLARFIITHVYSTCVVWRWIIPIENTKSIIDESASYSEVRIYDVDIENWMDARILYKSNNL